MQLLRSARPSVHTVVHSPWPQCAEGFYAMNYVAFGDLTLGLSDRFHGIGVGQDRQRLPKRFKVLRTDGRVRWT